ncbi:YSIRK-type signal peptide-containing protein, partial [uncultured Gemella sp.]|uniref:YSIRK-type signal peptide-containing protein n=1 Tax=uncultured Gemella sp. TaxID=254352 RepID=UPI00260D3D20
MKDIFNKRQRFSIRKLSFGVFSALLGVVLFGSPQEVLASTENDLTSSIESSSEIVNSITTVVKKEEVQNNSENRGNVSKLAPKDMSVVATRAAELREPGDKENNRTVKPTFVSGRDRSSNPETRASAPSSDIKKYELTEEYAKQIKSGEIGLEGNKLDSLLLDGRQLIPNGFTDDDYLMDKDEIYIYEKNGKKYVGYNSHPLLEDTDGDGIIDSKEKTDEKLKWNVSERDMIMFMELAYRDDDYIDKVLNHKRPLSESELFKRNSDKKPRYEYMMMNKELGPYWERKKSYHTPSGLDAVLFETKSDFPFLPNGTAQILAFRGTSDAKDIKADVTLGIGGNPQQGIDAENIISELAKDKSITNLYLTGHSLGGYLVQRAMVEAYQLAYSDRRVMTPKENVVYRNFYNNILKKGTTFNAPKVVTSLVSNSNFWQKGLDSKTIAKSGKITHYIVDNDQTIKKGVSNDSDVVINVGSTSGGHSSRSYFENDMINRRREFISGKRISLDGIGYQDKNISTIKSVEKVGEKIVYSKNGDDIFKLTTISIKDSDTGKVTENVINEIFKKDGLKDKVDVETIQSPIKYVKDTTREKGQENITVPGKAGSTTTTTTYTVNRETGEVTSNVGKPVIVAPTTTIIKVAAKDKVVYSKEGNNIVKETTTYDVNPENGNITENTTKEMFKENGLKDKVDVETIQSPIKYV